MRRLVRMLVVLSWAGVALAQEVSASKAAFDVASVNRNDARRVSGGSY